MSPGAIPFHPLANLFPLIDGAEFEALCADISEHGLRTPIQIWRGAIIDGRNRYRALCAIPFEYFGVLSAARAAGHPWFEDVSHIDVSLLPAHVVSLNLRRRHLDETQRALIAAKLADRLPGRPREGEAPENVANSPGLSQADAACLLNVSERSLRDAKALMREAPPPVLAAAERGEVSMHGARAGLKAAREAVAEQGAPMDEDAVLAAYNRLREDEARRKDARKARMKAERADREARLASKIAASNAALDAPGKTYGVILADPEWNWETWSENGKDRTPENHYPLSLTEVIAARPVANLAARDCVLFLWATAPRLPDALAVMAAWGFAYKSQTIWRKVTQAGDGLAIGTGYWFRNAHELLLVGVRGDVPCPAMGTQFASVIDAPVGPHSAKPERFHELIESYFPTLPKIELNARAARLGWDCWGAEAPEPMPEEVQP